MSKTFEMMVEELKNDNLIDKNIKINMLNSWKEKLILNNSNRIMDKEEAERHFTWISVIDKAIKECN